MDQYIEQVCEWYIKDKNRPFVISGYAGTGKTTLAKKIPKYLGLENNQVVFITPTGKAASIFKRARTIHSLIYSVREELKTGNLIFDLKDGLDVDVELIIVDEVSMVDQAILDDIAKFKIPTIYVGDPYQLPPVKGANKVFKNPNIFLKKIHRNAGEICELANLVRKEGKFVETEKYKILPHMGSVSLYEYYKEYDAQIICKLNRTRNTINNDFRTIIGYEDPLAVGERYIGLNNVFNSHTERWKNWFVNGRFYLIKEILLVDYKNHYAKVVMVQKDLKEEGHTVYIDFSHTTKQPKELRRTMVYELNNKIHNVSDLIYKEKTFSLTDVEAELLSDIRDDVGYTAETYKTLHYIDYSYAITCHKSQGSEFESAVVINEWSSQIGHAHWIYTAITRAKTNLWITKYSRGFV